MSDFRDIAAEHVQNTTKSQFACLTRNGQGFYARAMSLKSLMSPTFAAMFTPAKPWKIRFPATHVNL